MKRQYLTVMDYEIGTIHQYELPYVYGLEYSQLSPEIFDFLDLRGFNLRGFKSANIEWMVHDREGVFFHRGRQTDFVKGFEK